MVEALGVSLLGTPSRSGTTGVRNRSRSKRINPIWARTETGPTIDTNCGTVGASPVRSVADVWFAEVSGGLVAVNVPLHPIDHSRDVRNVTRCKPMNKLFALPVALVLATGSGALMAIAAVLLGRTPVRDREKLSGPI
jgi:hypothetical protein